MAPIILNLGHLMDFSHKRFLLCL